MGRRRPAIGPSKANWLGPESGSNFVARNTELPHLGVQRRALQSQSRSSTGRTADHSFGLSEYAQDMVSFCGLEGGRLIALA